MECFEAIKAKKPLFKTQINQDDFEKAKRVVFDAQDKYVSLVSETQIVIMSLEEELKIV